jgi:hypothetical protein
MNDTMNERLARAVSELRDLTPRFVAAIARFDERAASIEDAKNVDELEKGAEFWIDTAYRNALIRLRLILENNFYYLETLSVLATTRYVFETLVWLRLMYRQPDYGLIFLGRVISGQLQHFEALRGKLEDECELFKRLQREESALHEKSLQRLNENVKDLRPDHIAAATDSIMCEVDRKARRAFSLYAEDAKLNGFGFQAHLIEKQVIPQVNGHIRELEAKQKALATTCTASVRKKLKERWNWKAEARLSDMQAQYEFIYSFTSRLLHATPSSIFTDQKNLEVSEMVMFLDYIYVSMLDVLDLAKLRVGSDEKLN